MIAILDYGSGNIRSAERAFATTGLPVVVTRDPKVCGDALGLVVPGVGAFASCIAGFLAIDGASILKNRIEKSRPILGICVGMQILFNIGTENGATKGLEIWPGEVSLINNEILPHMGWNSVQAPANSNLFRGVEAADFYFVHSYAVKTAVPGALNSFTEYGETFLSAVETSHISATQFHPEKSGAAGLKMIANWVATL